MVQVQKQDRKRVYTYLLKEGIITIHKDFSLQPHKATGVPNLVVWMLLRSLKDRGFVKLIFNWQYYYYFLNQNGKKYLAQFLGLTEEIVPLSWKKDQKRQYEVIDVKGKVRTTKYPKQNTQQPQNRGRAGRKPPTSKPQPETPEQPESKPTEIPVTQPVQQ